MSSPWEQCIWLPAIANGILIFVFGLIVITAGYFYARHCGVYSIENKLYTKIWMMLSQYTVQYMLIILCSYYSFRNVDVNYVGRNHPWLFIYCFIYLLYSIITTVTFALYCHSSKQLFSTWLFVPLILLLFPSITILLVLFALFVSEQEHKAADIDIGLSQPYIRLCFCIDIGSLIISCFIIILLIHHIYVLIQTLFGPYLCHKNYLQYEPYHYVENNDDTNNANNEEREIEMISENTPLSKKESTRKQEKRSKTKENKNKNLSHPEKMTKRQWIIYTAYCWGFFALGIFTSAPGPILPTLEKQVNVSLAIISYTSSARAAGFVLGSIISGYVMDSYQKYLISPENGTRFLLKKNEKIADYLWSLPKWTCLPMSAHNVFSISIIIASIAHAAIPYVDDVYSLSILVTINGLCFGNINTFGNVLLLTLFDIEISHKIDFDLIYGIDADKSDNIVVDDDDDDDNKYNEDEEQQLIEPEVSSLYGSIPRDDIEETRMVRREKQDERVGPFMQFLQAIYALGGLLAPIFIQISFEISGDYTYSFWFFTLLWIPPGIILLFYPEPIRMSVISKRLKQIEDSNRSTLRSISNGGAPDIGQEEQDPVTLLNAQNKILWSRILCFGFAIFLLLYVGAQVGYGMYITTYCIDHLNTSGAIGRYLASANWAGLFVGRFVAVPLSHKMSALNMIRIDLIGMSLSCFISFFSLEWQYIEWISSVMIGFCMASVWPSMFVWAETLIPVTGTFASIMVGGGSLGEFIIPAVQGNIMAALGSQYFTHFMFAISIVLLMNLLINQIIAKRFGVYL